jgi:hypothetical protein
MFYKLLTIPHQDIEYEEPGKILKSQHIGNTLIATTLIALTSEALL